MTAPTPLRELSLFSGAGIGALAAQEAGIDTVAFCESDEWCRHALAGLWPGVPVFPDVAALTADALPGGIDIISGGFPCQDISSAGKGVGITGERSALWFEMLRLVREVRPSWVLAENVPALRTRGADVVIAGLEDAGYTAWPCVVGSDACGGPTHRRRAWLVARANCAGRRRERVHVQQRGSFKAVPVPAGNGVGFGAWPNFPGLPQHAEEAGRSVESSVGRSTDGLAGSLPPAARRAALRILGNAWVPQIPFLIYRWIVQQEAAS